MYDPTVYSLLAATIEAACNHALNYDPSTQAQLGLLDGKKILIRVSDFKIQASVNIVNSTLLIGLMHFDSDSHADVSIEGKFKDLISLARNNKSSLANTGVEVKGEIFVLEKLQAIIKQLDIDWADAIEQKLGSHAASPIIAAINYTSKTLSNKAASGIKQEENYFVTELALIPQKAEFEQFTKSTIELRMRTDRLSAKLTQHLNSKH